MNKILHIYKHQIKSNQMKTAEIKFTKTYTVTKKQIKSKQNEIVFQKTSIWL